MLFVKPTNNEAMLNIKLAVGITRKEKDAVILISEKVYLEYKNMIFELNKLKNKNF